MWVFADSWFLFVRKKDIIYQSTMPSPTAWKRSSVSGFIGTTCLQSGSFSRALLIQLTKAYFSSSVDTMSNPSVCCGAPLPSFYLQRQNSWGSLSHQCDWSAQPCVEEALRRQTNELRRAMGLGWLMLLQYPFPLTGVAWVVRAGILQTLLMKSMLFRCAVQMLSSARSNLWFHHNFNAFLYHSAK